MVIEIRRTAIRVHNSLRPSCGLLSRICRVRVLFPDIGNVPVLESTAFERYMPDEEITDFPASGLVFAHLVGLTTL